MKKLNYLLLISAIALSGFMFSCNLEDDDDDLVDPKPTITVSLEAGSETGWKGDQVTYEIILGSNENLESFSVTPDNANGPAENFFDTVFSKNTKSVILQYTYTIPTSGVNDGDFIILTFEVMDKESSNETTKTITVQEPNTGNPISTHDNITLGSFNNQTGSFCASIDGSVYTVSQAKSNQSKVDFLYFYGATNAATIAAPDDADANTISTFGLSSWTTKNSTKFKKVVNTIDWASVTNDEAIVAETASGVTASKINNLTDGDILAFITAGGKKGFIKVNSITTGNDGTINIAIKVQE